MKFFCLPSDFKQETIDAYHQINNKYYNSKIVETYSQMAPDTLFGSCRINRQLPKVDMPMLEKYIKYCRDRNIEFNYAVNATCMENDEMTSEGYQKINDKTLDNPRVFRFST